MPWRLVSSGSTRFCLGYRASPAPVAVQPKSTFEPNVQKTEMHSKNFAPAAPTVGSIPGVV